MAKGKAKSTLLGIQGIVGHKDVPDWGFIYEASLIKDPKWNIGDRVVLPDGREFRYAKSVAACISGQGCEFTATGAFGKYPITTVAVGGREVTLADSGSTTVLTHAAAYAEDVFRGGYVVFHDIAAGNADAQFRGIIGNAYSAINAVVKLYLDGPLHKAILTNTFTEVFENPYAALQTSASAALAVAGVPAVEVSAANMYFWVQKAGPVFVAPATSAVGGHGGMGCYWRHSGTVEAIEVALGISTVPAADSTQYAGHTLLGSMSGNGPLFMLKG